MEEESERMSQRHRLDLRESRSVVLTETNANERQTNGGDGMKWPVMFSFWQILHLQPTFLKRATAGNCITARDPHTMLQVSHVTPKPGAIEAAQKYSVRRNSSQATPMLAPREQMMDGE